MSKRDDVLERLRRLGFDEADADVLADHFLDAEARGRSGHGLARVDWLSSLPDLNPRARPERVLAEPGFERWQGGGALGYLTLAAICSAQLADPPAHARLVVAEDWLVAALTATSPPRLAHPDGGPPLAGTNPLAIAVPSSDGRPLVADVSMGRVTYGDVIAGTA